MKKTTVQICLAALLTACQLPTQVDAPIVTPPSVSVAAIGNWTFATPMATKRYFAGSVTDAAGLVYALGGYNGPGAIAGSGGTALTSVERFNPATSTWSAVASMQFPHQGGAYALGANGKIYAFGGGSSAVAQRVEAYDKVANTWTSVASMPTPRSYFAAATGSDGKIWLIGGVSGGVHLSTVEAYDPATDKWFGGPAMLTARSRLTAATGSDGRIYALGGTDGVRALNVVEQLNPTTLTWAAVAPLTTSRMDAAATSTATGQIYVLGGLNFGTTVSSRTEFYDPSLNGWIAEPNLNTGRRLLGATTGADGKIYAVGGANAQDTALATVEVLVPTGITTVSIQLTSSAGANTINPNLPDTVRVSVLGSASLNVNNLSTTGAVFGGTNQVNASTTSDLNSDGRTDRTYKFIASAMSLPIGTTEGCVGGTTTGGNYFKGCVTISLSATGRVWAAIASMSTPRFGPALVTGNDGLIYAIGGLNASGVALATVERYNPATNTWASVASMPSARALHAAVKGADGKLYVFGGSSGSAPLNTTVVYTVSGTGANTWATLANMGNTRDGVAGGLGSTGRIFAFGGTDDNTTVYQTGQSYNTGTNAWANITNMTQARFEHASVTGSNARIYVLGGWNAVGSATPMTSVESYSVGGNSWAAAAALPNDLAGLGAAADGSTILAIGGHDGTTTFNSTYQYTIASNIWSQLPGMTSPRAYHGVATGLDGKIYAVGGYDGQNYLSTAEVFGTQYNAGVPLQPLN